MSNSFLTLINLGISLLFILSLRGLAFPRTAYRSNLLGILGICLALTLALILGKHRFLILLGIVIGTAIGIFIAQHLQMTGLPQTVAAFNGLGGLAAFLVACCAVLEDKIDPFDTPIGSALGIFTFIGSFVAFAKLQGRINGTFKCFSNRLNALLCVIMILSLIDYALHPNTTEFITLSVLAGVLSLSMTLKIGGADMPIVISLLNAASGIDSAVIGFVLSNQLLIITGALIGMSGAILSFIMCRAMNRSLINVLFSPVTSPSITISTDISQPIKTGTPPEAAFLLENARKAIIVPGYGMAVSQAQHALKQMAKILQEKYHVDVKFAIHPVAGRMPGHMNVLLAEADVPFENIFSLNDINNEFPSADVAYVIGANDITNPLAKTDNTSPLYGMPILDVALAKTVLVVKRSLATGYSGIDNPLFYADNTIMLFGDAQKVTAEIVKALEH